MDITWKITDTDYLTSDGYITTAHWTCTGTDGAFSDSIYSTCSFPAPEAGMIPYANVTEAEVLNWCWAGGVDKEATEAAVQAKVELLKNPVVATGTPWGNLACVLLSATKTGTRSAELHFTAPYDKVFANVTYGGTTISKELVVTQGTDSLVAVVSGLSVGTNGISIYATNGTSRTPDSNQIKVVEIV